MTKKPFLSKNKVLLCLTVFTTSLFGGNHAPIWSSKVAQGEAIVVAMLVGLKHTVLKTDNKATPWLNRAAGFIIFDLCMEVVCQYGKRYLYDPLKTLHGNKDHRASENIQQQSLVYAREMAKGSWIKTMRLWYAQRMGYLTVYDGAHCDTPHYFDDNPATSACAVSHGGIFFPKGTLMSALSPEQRYVLCHEVAHVMNGDSTIFGNDNYLVDTKNGVISSSAFQQEYHADKQAIETLYKLSDREAVAVVMNNALHGIVSLFNAQAQGKPWLTPQILGWLNGVSSLLQKNRSDPYLQEIDQQLAGAWADTLKRAMLDELHEQQISIN